jgi:hypothetical protein
MKKQTSLLVVLLSVTIGLTACGSDSDGGATTPSPASNVTLEGIAAVGAPIVGGNVVFSCSGGVSPNAVTTNATGAWSASVAAIALPCALKVSGGTVNGAVNSIVLHTLAASAGRVNLTPLTDLIIAIATSAVPGNWFSSVTPAQISAAQAALVSAQTRALAALQASGYIVPAGLEPFTGLFAATTTDQYDQLLDALNARLLATGSSFAALVSQWAAAGAGSLNLPSAIAGGTGGGTSGGSGGGTGTLPASFLGKTVYMTFTNAVSGAPHTEGQQVLLTFSSSGRLFLTLQYLTVAQTYVFINGEYVWTSSTGLKYQLSLTPNGDINQVKVFNSANVLQGQFGSPVSFNGAGVSGLDGVLGSGPYKIAYSSSQSIGIDSRGGANLTVAIDSLGRMTGYDADTTCVSATTCERPLIGTNVVNEYSGDSRITIGRWNFGTTAGQYYGSTAKSFSSSDGFHYLVGQASGTLPTSGLVNRVMTANTAPTQDNGGVAGASATGDVAVDFAAARVAVDITINFGGTPYRVTTAGGLATPTSSELVVNLANKTFSGNIALPNNGTTCTTPSGCTAAFRGVIVGTSVATTRVGLVYVITRAPATAAVIRGAALF